MKVLDPLCDGSSSLCLSDDGRRRTRIRCFLPQEILELILSKLPAKSLLRCRCVSKSWLETISSIYFRNIMIEKSEKLSPSDNFIFVRWNWTKILQRSEFLGYYLLKLDNGRLENEGLVKPSESQSWGIFLCSCNGLILVRFELISRNIYALWNPSIGKMRKVPLPDMRGMGIDMGMGRGLCYDPIIGDFKIVYLARDNFLVYTCKTNTWSLKDSVNGHIIPGRISMGLSFGGAVYWITIVTNVYHLLKFDSKDDQMQLLRLPKDVENEEAKKPREQGTYLSHGIYLDHVRGSLYLWFIPERNSNRSIGFWFMNEEYSWIKLMDIDISWSRPPEGIWLINEGNDILFHIRAFRWKLLSYSRVNKKFQEIGHLEHSLGFMMRYFDCFVFPDGEGLAEEIESASLAEIWYH